MTTLPPLPPVPPEKVIRNAHGITINAGQDEEALRAWAIAYAAPFVNALEKIAAEEFVYKGYGNCDVELSLTQYEMADLARNTLMGCK